MARNALKLLILGGSGMLGHKLWQRARGEFDTYVTLRHEGAAFGNKDFFDPAKTFSHVAANDFESVRRVFEKLKPDVVVNCIGIVKQLKEAKDPLISIRINSLFPHELKEICARTNTRLIHISTDCVFSGKKGKYKEEDFADAEDLYGRTKYLGEVTGDRCLALRTSIIGRELRGKLGLVEWFLSQKGEVIKGYTRAIYTGFSTDTLARILIMMINDYPGLSGLYHVASEPITKCELLQKMKKAFSLPVSIQPFEDFYCDRSLDGSHFCEATGWSSPSWEEMVEELVENEEFYGGLS